MNYLSVENEQANAFQPFYCSLLPTPHALSYNFWNPGHSECALVVLYLIWIAEITMAKPNSHNIYFHIYLVNH